MTSVSLLKVTEKLRNAQELLRKDAEDFDWEI